MRAVVLGSGPLAIKIAEWFLERPDHELVSVVRRREEPEWTEKLSDWALARGVVCWPGHASVPDKDILAFSCFYDRILDAGFLARCVLALNLHASPLPRYRGMRPINWALKNGEHEHGVTIHEIDEGVDSGPIYAQVKFSIWPEVDEVKDVYERCLRYAWPLFTDTITRIESILPTPQDENDVLVYSMRDAARLGERASWTRGLSIAK